MEEFKTSIPELESRGSSKRRHINVSPLFYTKMREFQKGVAEKYKVNWSDRKTTDFIAENIDWSDISVPVKETAERHRGRPKRNFNVYDEDFRMFR